MRAGLLGVGLLLFLLYASPLLAVPRPLLAVLPLVNQRPQADADWMGFYLRSRIQTNLVHNHHFAPYSLAGLKVYLAAGKAGQAPSPLTNVLIQGGYQVVFALVDIQIKVSHYSQGKAPETKEFNLVAKKEKLDQELDQLSENILRWVGSKEGLAMASPFPKAAEEVSRLLFEAEHQVFTSDLAPSADGVVTLLEMTSPHSPPEQIASVAHLSLILSKALEGEEKKTILKVVEGLLRKASLEYPRNDAIYGALAQTYYFLQSFPSWVEKAAQDALQINPHHELALLLLAQSKGFSTGGGREVLQKLEQVSPWLFAPQGELFLKYHQGIFAVELQDARQAWQEMQNPNPLKLGTKE